MTTKTVRHIAPNLASGSVLVPGRTQPHRIEKCRSKVPFLDALPLSPMLVRGVWSRSTVPSKSYEWSAWANGSCHLPSPDPGSRLRSPVSKNSIASGGRQSDNGHDISMTDFEERRHVLKRHYNNGMHGSRLTAFEQERHIKATTRHESRLTAFQQLRHIRRDTRETTTDWPPSNSNSTSGRDPSTTEGTSEHPDTARQEKDTHAVASGIFHLSNRYFQKYTFPFNWNCLRISCSESRRVGQLVNNIVFHTLAYISLWVCRLGVMSGNHPNLLVTRQQPNITGYLNR